LLKPDLASEESSGSYNNLTGDIGLSSRIVMFCTVHYIYLSIILCLAGVFFSIRIVFIVLFPLHGIL